MNAYKVDYNVDYCLDPPSKAPVCVSVPVKKTGPKETRLADIVGAFDYRLRILTSELCTTPEAAIEKWKKELRDEQEQIKARLAEIDRFMAMEVPVRDAE